MIKTKSCAVCEQWHSVCHQGNKGKVKLHLLFPTLSVLFEPACYFVFLVFLWGCKRFCSVLLKCMHACVCARTLEKESELFTSTQLSKYIVPGFKKVRARWFHLY